MQVIFFQGYKKMKKKKRFLLMCASQERFTTVFLLKLSINFSGVRSVFDAYFSFTYGKSSGYEYVGE